MRVFKIRVVLDFEDDVFRDIEIPIDQTFEELHKMILRSFEFPEGEMASFYMSNDNWDKGDEITLMDMGAAQEGQVLTMNNVALKEMIEKPGDKLVYVYDFLRMWCFYVELLDLNPTTDDVYPRITLALGTAPAFESKEIDFGVDDTAFAATDLEEKLDKEEKKDDIFEDFDDFDNLQYE